jgi:hypothetical protein
MDKFNNKLREVYKVWSEGIEKFVSSDLNALFRFSIHYLGTLCKAKNYKTARIVTENLAESFYVKNYQRESWGPEASKIWSELGNFEKLLSTAH